MSTTLLTVRNLVLNLLNEASDSVVGNLDSTTAGSPTQSTTATLNDLINKGAARICKSCVAIEDTGTVSPGIGALSVPLAGLTTTGGGTLWAASAAAWNGTSLTRTTKGYVNINYPTLLTDAAGTPAYWYPEGQYAVGMAPALGSVETLQVWGYATPPLLVNDTDTASWMQDDEMIYVAYWAAYMAAQKNIEDTNLQIKVMPWKQEFEAASQRLWQRLLQGSPQVARGYFGVGG